ncbi:MAG: fumarate reductase, partial [Nocardioidaceae bacterium]|nr:fumarate reductase [Nocardioidaceae bacterium]
HRADLHRTLLDAVAEPNKDMKDVDVRFGIDIVRAESEGAGGVAIDADGNQYKADVIIGADGLHSNIRKSIGIFDEPTFEGNILWWSLIPIEDLRKDPMHAWLEPRLAVWVGPERHVVHFLVRRGEFLMLAAIVPWEEEMPESWSAVGDRDAAIEPFEVWDEKLYKLMQLAKEVHPWPLLDRNPFDYWTQGRIALLGDACHPMLPHQAQGAAQSVEDAWILAEKLTEADTSSVEEALKAYEEARKPRATVIQQASRDHGEAYHLPDGPAQQKRDEIMAKNFGNAVVTFDWLWGGTPDSLPPKD